VGPNNFLNTPFSKALNLYTSLNVWESNFRLTWSLHAYNRHVIKPMTLSYHYQLFRSDNFPVPSTKVVKPCVCNWEVQRRCVVQNL
jgi:hypothetical protein